MPNDHQGRGQQQHHQAAVNRPVDQVLDHGVSAFAAAASRPRIASANCTTPALTTRSPARNGCAPARRCAQRRDSTTPKTVLPSRRETAIGRRTYSRLRDRAEQRQTAVGLLPPGRWKEWPPHLRGGGKSTVAVINCPAQTARAVIHPACHQRGVFVRVDRVCRSARICRSSRPAQGRCPRGSSTAAATPARRPGAAIAPRKRGR